jgi:hypothetical protein
MVIETRTPADTLYVQHIDFFVNGVVAESIAKDETTG